MSKRLKSGLHTALLAIFCVAAAGAATTETLDGVLHVKNGAEPENGVVVMEPEFMWERGGDDDDVMFGVTGSILCDADGNTYVLDRQLSEIQVFDESGEWLRSIGREGEGPGEFQNGADMFWSIGGSIAVMQMMPGKIVQMTTEGDPVGTYPIGREGFLAMLRVRRLGEQLVMAGSTSNFADGKMERDGFLQLIGSDGAPLTKYTGWEGEVDFSTLEFQELDLDGFGRHWAVGTKDRVFAALEWDSYAITVWNEDGSIDRVIEREYVPTARDDARMEEVKEQFHININGRDATILTEKNERVVNEIYPRPNGTIWVRNDRGLRDLPDGILTSVDEFDAAGVYTRRIDFKMPGDIEKDLVTFTQDRVYVTKGWVDARGSLGPARGGDDEEEDDGEMAEPLSVISYRIFDASSR